MKGNIVDIYHREIYPGEIGTENGKILSVNRLPDAIFDHYILPGFIDAHVHIESSMLVPSEFARMAVVHGTVATVSDPHEIANVCGMPGVDFMIRNGSSVNFKFNYGAPACVPATTFETAGDKISADDIDKLLGRSEIRYLSEMMNFPGVIFNEVEVMKKIEMAHRHRKPIDGHAPGLRGEPLKKYIAAGISTDHECFTKEEALEKLKLGMKILIREGSAARNFDTLVSLLNEYPDRIMFCSDDKHPDGLSLSHINALCARAVAYDIDLFHVLQAACINPVQHYHLDVGTLRINDPADFIVVEDLSSFKVIQTFINGECVAENGRSKIERVIVDKINKFSCSKITAKDIAVSTGSLLIDGKLPVIEALDGQLVTNKLLVDPDKVEGNDILKIVVVNRYHDAPPAVAWVKGFTLREGAIASSVAHDSHNIIATGVDDESIVKAINLIIEQRGGISCAGPGTAEILPLPVAGLMSDADGYKVAAHYTRMNELARMQGSTLAAPFMTLSFMALLVIPSLKISDRGLFDGDSFSFVSGAGQKSG